MIDIAVPVMRTAWVMKNTIGTSVAWTNRHGAIFVLTNGVQ